MENKKIEMLSGDTKKENAVKAKNEDKLNAGNGNKEPRRSRPESYSERKSRPSKRKNEEPQ